MKNSSKSKTHRAVFLDRDGVINENLYDWDMGIYSPTELSEFKLLPGVGEAISALKALGFKLVVFSNQPQIARGTLKPEVLAQMDAVMKRLGIDAVYNCPHHPSVSGECDCRKPKPGLIIRAAEEMGIDVSRSYVVGDREGDLVSGKACGTKVMIGSRRCDVCKIWDKYDIHPDHIVKDLPEAARVIASLESNTKKEA